MYFDGVRVVGCPIELGKGMDEGMEDTVIACELLAGLATSLSTLKSAVVCILK